VPDFNTLLSLTGDEQFQSGLFCGSTFATPTSPIRTCGSNLGVTRLTIPPAGTFDPDKNPTRIAPRHLIDASIGWDNIFNKDHYKWNLRLTAINLTNKDALYNFLSTFSGTHFVTPRTWKAEIGFDF
jgi:outer membrane receptor protein involved in Fe transport